jgi:hypothetical protein
MALAASRRGMVRGQGGRLRVLGLSLGTVRLRSRSGFEIQDALHVRKRASTFCAREMSFSEKLAS